MAAHSSGRQSFAHCSNLAPKGAEEACIYSDGSWNNRQEEDDHCHTCFQTGSHDSLTVGLSRGGDYSTSAMDNMINLFEDHYGPEECSPDLWKAFFRKHAMFYTICDDCTKTNKSNQT